MNIQYLEKELNNLYDSLSVYLEKQDYSVEEISIFSKNGDVHAHVIATRESPESGKLLWWSCVIPLGIGVYEKIKV